MHDFKHCTRRLNGLQTITLSTIFGAVCHGALAQASAQPIEDVLVTAQRRETAEQLTPVAISVLNSDLLLRDGVYSLADAVSRVPSVQSIPHQNAASTLRLYIRGIGNNDEQVIQDPSVAVYLDDVYLGRNQGLAADVVDLERIEVLRGPQGTLYGRNASGGAVRLITQRPSVDALSVRQRFELGERDLLRSSTMLNLPLGERAALRLNYHRAAQDGFVDNRGSGEKRFGDQDREAWRTDLLWHLTERLRARITADSADIDDTPQWVGIAPTGQTGPDRPSASLPSVDTLRANSASASGQSLTLEWDVGDNALVRSITSHRELSDFQNQIYHPGLAMGNPLLYADARGDQEQWSQELQLIGSSNEETFDYVGGLFWFDETNERNATNTLYPRRQRMFVYGNDLNSTSAAAYGQVGWRPDILDHSLRLSLGLRWSEDAREATLRRAVQDLSTGNIMVNPVPGEGDRDFDNLSAQIIAQWQANDTTMVYISMTDGYKSGGFNARASSVQRFNEGFDDETLRSWELGVKTRLLDERLQLNAVAFYADYEDIQVTVQSDSGNPVIVDLLNAGRATVQGAELSMQAILSDGLSASIEYAWLDTGYDHIADANANANNVADRYRFLYSPEHAINARLRYRLSPTRIGTPEAELQYSWQDDMYASDTAVAGDYRIAAYGLLNARVALSAICAGPGQMEVGIWGRNLLDEEYTTARFAAGLPSATWGQPQTFGVDLSYRF